MKDRSLQRLLREIDARTIAESICNLNSNMAEKIIKNVSVRTASSIIDEFKNGNNVNTLITEGAQNSILKVIQKLVESKDIVI